MEEITFTYNPKYRALHTSKKRYKDIWGGRGRGGSHTGTEYFIDMMTRPEYFRGYFVRKYFSDIKDSLYQDAKDRIFNNETLNPNDFLFNEKYYQITYLPTGNKIISKGAASTIKSRKAKLKSFANVTHILIEECNELSEQEFDQLDDSIRTTMVDNVEIIRLFNPPEFSHWIWRDYNLVEHHKEVINGKEQMIYFAEPKSNADIESIHSTYYDNIKNINETTRQKYERHRERNPIYYWNQIRGLIVNDVTGKVYTGWQKISDEFYSKVDCQEIFIVDFGYSNDPAALIGVKWMGLDRYVKEYIYQNKLSSSEFAERLSEIIINKQSIIVADPGNGGDLRISDLRRGIITNKYGKIQFPNIIPAIKGAGSINFGISKLQSVNVFATESSSNLWYEYDNYKYYVNQNGAVTDAPIDDNNHIMDCLRYFESRKGVNY